MRRTSSWLANLLKRLAVNERAATAIEYGLIASLIAIAAIVAMRGFSNQLKSTFNTASSAMSAGPAA